MRQLIQVAHFIQAIPGLFLQLSGTAGANLEFAKIGMSNREIMAKITYPAADLTIRITRVRPGAGINLR